MLMIDLEKIEQIRTHALHHITIQPEAKDPWDKLYLINVIFGLTANAYLNEEIEAIARMVEEQRFEVEYPVHPDCGFHIELNEILKNIAVTIRERKRRAIGKDLAEQGETTPYGVARLGRDELTDQELEHAKIVEERARKWHATRKVE